MPYRKQGIETTEGSLRISLSYLFKRGYLIRGAEISSALSWSDNWGNNTGTVGIKTCFKDSEKWIRLVYTVTDNRTGEKINRDYKVYITSIDSNLGKGKVYYFVCPVSGSRCRILYRAYGSHYFRCRTAYRYRLYYYAQSISKYSYATERFFKLEKDIEKLNKTRLKTTYRGKETRTYKRLMSLQDKRDYFDNKRFESLGYFLLKHKHKINGI